jgi:hypothetical protein
MEILKQLQVYAFDKKIRLGANSDGGYVIADLEGGYDCYISAGISNEESFSRDFLQRYPVAKKDTYGFDGTIEEYPYQYTTEIQFIKKNINSFNDSGNTDLGFLMNEYSSIFLKMDIECGEYPWLLQCSTQQLDRFKQIVIEFHGIVGCQCHTPGKAESLEKLNSTHYIVHAHGNNYGMVIDGVPDVIELTYINKRYFDGIPPELNTIPFPINGLDFPNGTHTNDIKLYKYPFVKQQ